MELLRHHAVQVENVHVTLDIQAKNVQVACQGITNLGLVALVRFVFVQEQGMNIVEPEVK